VFLEATVTVSDKASNLYLYDGNDQVISEQHIDYTNSILKDEKNYRPFRDTCCPLFLVRGWGFMRRASLVSIFCPTAHRFAPYRLILRPKALDACHIKAGVMLCD
jgi:hypothetical protein